MSFADFLAVLQNTKAGGPRAHGPPSCGPDARGPDARGPDTRGPDTRGPDTRGPDARADHTHGPSASARHDNGSPTAARAAAASAAAAQAATLPTAAVAAGVAPSVAALIAPLRTGLQALPAGTAVAGIGLSGGADSAMLAACAAALCAAPAHVGHWPRLVLYHVHHGLYDEADAWSRQAEGLAAALSLPLRILKVQVHGATGAGIEAAARVARYEALSQAARDDGVSHLLLAHHRDDQAETVLLRLLRGSGPQGLAAMAPVARRDGLTYLRPWLDVARTDILAVASACTQLTGWQPVSDPSNADPRYTRAALRTQLTPVLDARWPGWQRMLARHARLAAASAEILDEVASDDLRGLQPDADGAGFSLQAWRALSPARQAHVLRHWLGRQGAQMPGEARLADLIRQLRQLHALGHDRHLVWESGGHRVRCERGRVRIETRSRRKDETAARGGDDGT